MNNYERMFFEKSNSQPVLGNHPKDVPMVNFAQDDFGGNPDPFRMSSGSNRSNRAEGSFREKQGSALKGESEFMPIN